MHSRSRANYNKMTEIGNELMKLKGSPEENKDHFVRNSDSLKMNIPPSETISQNLKTG